MNRAYLLLGSNLLDRLHLLALARDKITVKIGHALALSSIYESEPWGFMAEQNFLNQVMVVETALAPEELLTSILEIESDLGRTRLPGAGYQSRPIDIDILFYNEEVISGDMLDIPHPRIHERLFTLMPLVELDGEMLHPGLRKTTAQLLEECSDRGKVSIFKKQG